MAKGNRNGQHHDKHPERKNAGHGDAMGHRDARGAQRQHNDSAGRGSQDNSRREQGADSKARR